MRNNIDKVLERDSKLNDLDYRLLEVGNLLIVHSYIIFYRKGKQFTGHKCSVSTIFQKIKKEILVAVSILTL